MMPNCEEKMSGSLTNRKKEHQLYMVDTANKYTNQRLLEEKLPYFDMGAMLRSAERCNKSADGLHVALYVNLMAAKVLFNHLCDPQGHWRGSPAAFT